MAKNRPENAIQLKPEDESVLTFSIAFWLEKKGYTKVLKRFLTAAQIELISLLDEIGFWRIKFAALGQWRASFHLGCIGETM